MANRPSLDDIFSDVSTSAKNTRPSLDDIFTGNIDTSITQEEQVNTQPLTWSEVGDIVKRNAYNAYRESISPVIRGVGFGLPQAIVEGISPGAGKAVLPQPETLSGQAIEMAGGMLPASKIVGGTSQLLRTAPVLAKQTMLNQAIRGGIGGAVAGLAYTPEQAFRDFSSNQQRIGQGVFGGLLGMASEVGTGIVGKMFREYKKVQARPAKELSTRIQWKKSDVSKSAQQKISSIKDENNKAIQVIGDNVKLLTQQLDEASKTGAIDIQKQLPQFFKRNSNSYGTRLDDIAEELATRPGTGFTYKDANKIISDSLDEISGLDLPEGQAEKYIEKLVSKYTLKSEPSKILSQSGKPIVKEADLSKPVDFKEFKNDIQGVWKQLSSRAKTGQGYAPEDVAGNILRKNFGEYVSEQVPEFVELQQSYRPIVEGMKLSGKLFKPLDDVGLKNINQAANLLKRQALKKATPQEQKLLKMLAKGSEFGEGINVPTKPSEIGAKLTSEKQRMVDIQRKSVLDVNKISEESRRRIAKLEARYRNVSNLEARKANADRVKNALLWLFGLTGAGTIGGALVRSGKELQSIEGMK